MFTFALGGVATPRIAIADHCVGTGCSSTHADLSFDMEDMNFILDQIKIAERDMSTAWIAGVISVHAFQISLMDERAQRDDVLASGQLTPDDPDLARTLRGSADGETHLRKMVLGDDLEFAQLVVGNQQRGGVVITCQRTETVQDLVEQILRTKLLHDLAIDAVADLERSLAVESREMTGQERGEAMQDVVILRRHRPRSSWSRPRSGRRRWCSRR